MTERERGKMEETMDSNQKCQLCGEPMPKGEEMFNYHGYSGPCPKPPLPQPSGAGEELEARPTPLTVHCNCGAGDDAKQHGDSCNISKWARFAGDGLDVDELLDKLDEQVAIAGQQQLADQVRNWLRAALRHSTPSAPTLVVSTWGASEHLTVLPKEPSGLDLNTDAIVADARAARGTPSAGEDEK